MSSEKTQPLLSVVVPVYNEHAGLTQFHKQLLSTVRAAIHDSFEIIYCDDGSTDRSGELVRQWYEDDKHVTLLTLSRNFGKEIATSAGLHAATGQAALMLDADGQHPVELIPEFIARWQAGSKVVVGVKLSNQKEGLVKRTGSRLFHGIFNRLTGMNLKVGATDFRLIDQVVVQEFVRLTERNRITRGLIDWLGYEQTYIEFHAKARVSGDASYSFSKLFKLAIDSAVSMSLSPLYITAYIGAFVLPVSALLGLLMVINAIVGDPFSLDITGGAYVMVLILFLIGILLMSQGIIGLYLSHIHSETQNRPLYIIDHERSRGA